MRELRVLAGLSFGYEVPSFEIKEGMKWDPDIIVSQGTSTDIGPYYLGAGKTHIHKNQIKKNIEPQIIAALEHEIPFIFSVGSAGADTQLNYVLESVNEISKENKLRFRVAVISGEINKSYLLKKLDKGEKMKRLIDTPRLPLYLSKEMIEKSEKIVSQMGPEPIMKALEKDVDGVITGRALDVGLHLAMPLKCNYDKGISAHMAKVIECGAMATVPGGLGAIFAFLRDDHFLVKPTNPQRKCTIHSVASHTFYERPDPFKELNPGGYLDVSEAKYEQFDERTVKVWGSKWVPMKYTVKLEGVEKVGYRTITIAGIRDPIMIKNIDDVENLITNRVEKEYGKKRNKIFFRKYGKNGVLGESEPQKEIPSKEMCLIIDVVADTQERANDICGFARSKLLLEDYPERITTAGNVALPYAPNDIEVGVAYQWNIWHGLPLTDPCEPFKTRIIDFPRRQGGAK
jgi:hypothetical protein